MNEYTPPQKGISDIIIHLIVFIINASILYFFSINESFTLIVIPLFFFFHLINFIRSSPSNIDGFIPLLMLAILLSFAAPQIKSAVENANKTDTELKENKRINEKP
ncbi:MAG: hypothetical protein COA79_21495 [Planctomycetota bacterium]|nr:MAG: hypothetical protein COA79_21495 [Planctomycetota bacterium]